MPVAFIPLRRRPGYMFLVSVLAIGAIASAASISLALLGWASEQNGKLAIDSMRALEYARTCTEHALLALGQDSGYDGNETIVMPYGECVLMAVGGTGNEDRTICAEGSSEQSIRRLEVSVMQVRPQVAIETWREVTSFSLCP